MNRDGSGKKNTGRKKILSRSQMKLLSITFRSYNKLHQSLHYISILKQIIFLAAKCTSHGSIKAKKIIMSVTTQPFLIVMYSST